MHKLLNTAAKTLPYIGAAAVGCLLAPDAFAGTASALTTDIDNVNNIGISAAYAAAALVVTGVGAAIAVRMHSVLPVVIGGVAGTGVAVSSQEIRDLAIGTAQGLNIADIVNSGSAFLSGGVF